MKLWFRCEEEDNVTKVIVSEKQDICQYIYFHKKEFSDKGKDIVKTTLTSWAMLDFSVADEMVIDIPITLFEKEYLGKNFEYCVKLYQKVYRYKMPNISYPIIIEKTYEKETLNEVYYLGYTQGKDSTLCKMLLDETGKTLDYYKVSYDDDEPADDGHIYCEILDQQVYNKYTITGWKAESDIISFQQADDIHVTFSSPYVYEKSVYGKYLAVGIPWDAIHQFKDGTSDLVPTESYPSIMFFEELIHQYGFEEFKVISPIASLHTYGVYSVLSEIIGIEELLSLDSCWDAYEYKQQACGYCPKCQRIKAVFRDCFNREYISEVPCLKIDSADFLFGSLYATDLLRRLPTKEVMNSILVDDFSKAFSGEYMEILEKKYHLDRMEVEKIEYVEDQQTWDEIRQQLVDAIGMNYTELNDEKVNSEKVPYLPFEKYYKWNRQNRILNCYRQVTYFDSEQNMWCKVSLGENGDDLTLVDNEIFRRYIRTFELKTGA